MQELELLRVSRINVTIMTNDIKKIQYGFIISDKVIPDNSVQTELLYQNVNFSYIGVEEYPHVSSDSYYKLAKELIMRLAPKTGQLDLV